MEKNELRIGNLVNIEHETSDFEYIHFIIAITNNEALIKCNETSDWYNYEEISPIPLTEEWLVKMGFERKYANWIWNNESIVFNFDNENNCGLFLAGSRHVNFHYVHQLQNLVFSLTGKELVTETPNS